MKKIYYSILFLTLTFSVVTANNSKTTFLQDDSYKISEWTKFIDNYSTRNWKPGFKTGINLNEFIITEQTPDNTKYRVGYNFGIFMDYTGERFIFQPGLNYFSKGSKISIRDNESSGERNWTVRLNYIEFPLRVGVTVFNHHFGGVQPVRINATPYFAYALNGKYVDDNGSEKIHFGDGINNFKPFDYGIKVGISAAFKCFEPSFGYDFGLNGISNYGDTSVYNRGFYFTVAMVFGK